MAGTKLQGLRDVAVTLLVMLSGASMSVAAETAAPQMKVDPFWPKTLPNNWTLGQIAGLAVDAKDNVWVIQRPGSLTARETKAARTPPAASCCIPAPPVIEFDSAGQVVRAWGGPGKGYDWPSNEHGITVDPKGNVWILGNGSGPLDANGQPDRSLSDGMALKFTADGKFLLQIGGRGPAKDSQDTTRLNKAAKIVFDAQGNEAYIADGYVNHRVIVFDANTGAFKRMWGAYGKPPTDIKVTDRSTGGPLTQFNVVHCVVRAADGLVYVCDRQHHRIQVFKSDGSFVNEFSYLQDNLDGTIPGKVADLAIWPDRKQSMLIIADGNTEAVRLVRRDNGKPVTSIGRQGNYAGEFNNLHVLTVDSRGNIYTGEAGSNRVQKFFVEGANGTPLASSP